MFWRKKPPEPPKAPARADIIARAKATASAKREEIGEEALDRIRQAIIRKQNDPLERAKAKIKSMEEIKVSDHVRGLLRGED